MYSTKVRAVFKGRAERHFEYITRTGPFTPRPFNALTGRPAKFVDLVCVGHGNMPSWAHDCKTFWQQSDRYERTNGTSARSVMFALQRGVPLDHSIDLVEEFCRRRFGARHAFVWAIHNPKAALEGGDHPHVHIIFCERILDGRTLGPDRYFSRVNRQDPSRGGYAKIVFASMWERRLDLIRLRAEVADLINDQLQAHGFDTRVTHLSYADRGIPVEPEKWIGYERDPRLKQIILDLRRARYAVVAACQELADATVAMEADVYDVEARTPKSIVRRVPVPVPSSESSSNDHEDDEAAERAYYDGLHADEEEAEAIAAEDCDVETASYDCEPEEPDEQPDPNDD